MSDKEQSKKGGGGGIIGLIIFIIIAWLVYDNLIASHWVVVYSWQGTATYAIDDTQKFKDAASCLAYATNLNAQAAVLQYQCGYRCKEVQGAPFVTCEKWS